MKKEQKLKLALSRLSELQQRRIMLIENHISLRHIDEDISETVSILDEILGNYYESLKVFERIKNSRNATIQSRYLEGIDFLLRANGLCATMISRHKDSVNIIIERHP